MHRRFPTLRTLALALALTVVGAACGGGGGITPSRSAPSGGSPSATPSTPFLTYTNQDAGFTVRYPPDWEQSESVQGTVVLFKSPAEGPTDQVRESVGVSTEQLPSASYTLDAYTSAAMRQIQQAIPAFQLIASQSATLAGHPAHELVYTGTQDTTALEWLQLYTIVDGTSYILTFAAAPDSFTQFEATARAMFDSFALS